MRAAIRIVLPVQVFFWMLGCAARAPAPPDSLTRTGAAQDTTARPAADGTAIDQGLIRRGYHVRTLNGELKYCRSEPVTGSMFSNTVCLTLAEIKTREDSTQSSVNAISRGHATCFNSKCD